MPFANDRIEAQRREAELRGEAGAGERRHGDLESRLAARIVGQPAAVRAVAHAIELGRSGLGEPDRPLSCTLLVGPTGVGKTELVRQVASEIRTGRDDLCRIDMSSLAQEHYMASLSGAPPGYAGSREDFSLFDSGRVEGDFYTPGIVLFDELEKAHTSVLRALLHVMDHGVLRLANGNRTIDFRNAHLFFTSNLGARELFTAERTPWGRARAAIASARRRDGAGSGGTQRIVRRVLERRVDPEFLNRFDEIVCFDALDADAGRAVAELELAALTLRCARRGLTVVMAPEVAEVVYRAGFDRAYGARSVRRAVRSLVAVPIARAAHDERGTAGTPLTIEVGRRSALVSDFPVQRAETRARAAQPPLPITLRVRVVRAARAGHDRG
ncbi:ATP-dependent Clp protease ATP-binding subunit [Rhodococcus rhodnii]|uniref:ATP-binding subunit of ATP-dependent Clp n=2 Tax=Rhodococcus rhodnii TaxID=38312 RepID=R7WPT7_9NOCA|nr:AAA family ATPase [Rhodococcus rhodnii]EOM77326.1 ATP-binding subunit of ATP-dependent Clp [Rhodococcus rhodnii LMG 5362]TXG91704.1 ATP-dependent Clp protease ATP-binding subunit [Rhodococcus rhodnii]